MGLMVATKAFFKLMFNAELSDSFQQMLDGKSLPAPNTDAVTSPKKPATPPKPTAPTRSDAISLLAALQREARFVDLVNESLGDYSDEQVGAAAREVLEESGKVIKRMFALEPVTTAEDGSEISTTENFDPAVYRLTGNVGGQPPYNGQLAHHGWRSTKCDVPTWSGSKESASIVAPVEIEIA
jgi:hypothetical protein